MSDTTQLWDYIMKFEQEEILSAFVKAVKEESGYMHMTKTFTEH